MTSQRQLMKVCDCGLVFYVIMFCESLGFRRVYLLHIAAIRNMINEIVARIFVFQKQNKTKKQNRSKRTYFSARRK